MTIEHFDKVVNYTTKMFPNIDFVVGLSNYRLKDNFTNKDSFINNISKFFYDNAVFILTTPNKKYEQVWHKYLSSDQSMENWISELLFELLFIKRILQKSE